MNKQKIAIMADSGTDVPPNYRKKYNIYWLPLLINYSDGQYLDGVDIQPHEMYDRLPTEIPKTSLPDRGMVTDLFDQIKADGYEKVLVVTISSGLSGTFNMVRLAAEEYEGLEVSVLDTRNISIGSGLIAIRAAQMVNDEGMEWNELLIRIKHEVPKSKVFFCVDTLKYLQKGGRIGLVSAMLGMSLSIKPNLLHCRKGDRQSTFHSEGARSRKGFCITGTAQRNCRHERLRGKRRHCHTETRRGVYCQRHRDSHGTDGRRTGRAYRSRTHRNRRAAKMNLFMTISFRRR